MDGYIVGSMISANSITGEQIQANSIKTANLELSVQKKIQDATDEETVKALIKADLDGFESTLSKEFVTVENAATQIQQATEVAVKEATQNIIDNAVSESMGAVDGQLNDKLNQYTSGTLLPAIAEKAEEVLQNAEDYVVTQLESYATKQELSSSISQTREQIELSVSEKYTTKTESTTIITEAIDGITVGAINRVLGTGENKSFKFNGGANETWLPYKFSNDISDKEVFVSFKYTLTGTAQNGSQIEFAPSYLKKANNQTVYRPKHVFFTSDRLQDVNITDTVSFTTKDFQDISPSSTSYIRFVGNGFTGTLSVSEVQIKQGNSKTSWSPAPEDTITDITNAKNDAIGSANDTLIATIANYYTKYETDSAISVAKDEINLGVSNTYETKANVETKINNISIGSRNYLTNTKNSYTMSTNQTGAGYNTFDPYRTPSYKYLKDLGFKVGDKLTIGFNWSISKNGSNNLRYGYAGAELCGKTSTSDYAYITSFQPAPFATFSSTNTSGRFESTLTVTEAMLNVSGLRIRIDNSVLNLTISNVKLEKGNKPTDWNKAIEDVDNDVSTAKNEAINSANNTLTTTIANYYTKAQTDSQINVAKNAITQSVSSTYATKTDVTSSINGVNSSISNLQTRMNTAESKITDNAITNVVKQNFYTKTETENAITSKDYATKSEVQQTANNITYKFSQSGGYNLIRNGGFENGRAYWAINGQPNILESQSWQNYDGKSIFITGNGQGHGIYQFFSTVPGKTYSYSFYAQAEYGEWWVGVENRHAQNVVVSPNDWRRYSGTFTATETSHAFICYAHGSSRNIFIDNVMVCEGSVPLPYSPNPNEVYDGVTTIDRDGITVTHSNANTKSTMSADGFKVVRTSDNKNLFSATSGNLTMEGTLSTGTSGQYIKASDGDYKVYEDGTLKGFLGFRNTSNFGMSYDVPKIWLGASGISSGNSYFAVCDYKATGNPQNYGYGYADIAYRVPSKEDWSNIKMYGDGMMRIAPVQALEITSNYSNGSYGGTGENLIAKFSTSVSSYYNGHLDIGAITNYDKNSNGLVLEHNRNGVWCAARVNVDSNNEKFFRPMTNSSDMKLGSSGFKWNSVWASNGSVQTSDERHKMKMGVLNNEDCYQMVKNTDIYKYCMLPKSKDDMSEDEIKKMAKKASKEEIAIQTGIMAQDILGYDCAKYVLTHDSWLDEESDEEKEMYNINPYGFTSVIMGALKEEISKREALEKRIETLEEKLSQLISLQKQQTQE